MVGDRRLVEKQLSKGSKEKEPWFSTMRPWMAQEGWKALRNALPGLKFTNTLQAGRTLSEELSVLKDTPKK